ncbi:MAG: PilZ domain-containing protein [Acidobacteriota bacterium]
MDRRGLSRRSLLRSCRYRIGSREIQARLIDISWDGARVGDASEVPKAGAHVSLLLGSGDSEAEINGYVIHAEDTAFGVKFAETRGTVMRKLRGLV